jgi:hypothetical protein
MGTTLIDVFMETLSLRTVEPKVAQQGALQSGMHRGAA